MKFGFLATSLAFALAFGGAVTASAQTNPSAHASHAAPDPAATLKDVPSDSQAAVSVVERFHTALSNGDLKSVGSLLSEDVLILETGGAERSRDEYLGYHAIGDANFLKGTHSEIKHRTVRIDGSLAWVGTESELHASEDGKPMTLLSTETMVLKNTPAGWQIVHIHWSSRPKKAS